MIFFTRRYLLVILIMRRNFKNKNRMLQENRQRFNKKNIFDYVSERIMEYKNTPFYRYIYKHPILSITFVIIWGVVIIFMFFYFLFTLYQIAEH
jgi:hypothetical protein